MDTDAVFFNIDSKADQRSGRDAIAVFLRVLNEMQGYSGDHPQIAHLERYLEKRGKLNNFHDAFRAATGLDWTEERDAYHFHRDQVIDALRETLGQSRESSEKWVNGAEESFALTIENFCKWVKDFLDLKGPDHRIVFLVDEVGQFIGESDELRFNVTRDRVHVHDLHATILHLLGFDHNRLTYRFQGRDFRLTDVSGAVIDGLIA